MTRRDHMLYAPLPKGPVRIKRVIWLVLGFLCVGWSMVLGSQALLRVELVSARSYLGELRPKAGLIDIALPPGSILQDTLVHPGDAVTAGQTLALLDAGQLQLALDHLATEEAHDQILRRCLLAGQHPRSGPSRRDTDPPPDMARTQCAALLDEELQIAKTAAVTRENLIEKRALLSEYLGQLADDDAAGARQVVAIALARNALDAQITALDADTRDRLQAARLERIAQARTVTRQIADLHVRQRHLTRLLAAPRITAPRSGTITRVRSLHSGTAASPEPLDFIVLRPTEAEGFALEFTTAANEAAGLALGQSMVLTLPDLLPEGPALRGDITRLHSLASGAIRAEVSLDRESNARLNAPAVGLALQRADSVTRMRVSRGTVHLGQEMAAILSDQGWRMGTAALLWRDGVLWARRQWSALNLGQLSLSHRQASDPTRVVDRPH